MEALQQFLASLIGILPRLVGALLIFLVGYVIARSLATILRRLLRAVGIDKLASKLQAVDIVARAEIEISLSAIVAQVVYYFVMLVVLVAATDVLGLTVVSNLVSSAIEYLPNLLAAFIILIIGVLLADALREITTVACRSFAIPAAGMIGSVVFWFVFVAILITALGQAQLETEFVTVSVSIVLAGLALAFALAYGLAAKPLMGGFLAQFYNRGKVNVGDRIAIGGEEGTIVSIDRASFSLDASGQLLIVPLSKLQSETVRIIERGPASDPLVERATPRS